METLEERIKKLDRKHRISGKRERKEKSIGHFPKSDKSGKTYEKIAFGIEPKW